MGIMSLTYALLPVQVATSEHTKPWHHRILDLRHRFRSTVFFFAAPKRSTAAEACVLWNASSFLLYRLFLGRMQSMTEAWNERNAIVKVKWECELLSAQFSKKIRFYSPANDLWLSCRKFCTYDVSPSYLNSLSNLVPSSFQKVRLIFPFMLLSACF